MNMLRHNLLLTFRSFKRSKAIFIINLIGLTSGLACTLLIYLWVKDELSVDQFFPEKDRLCYAWEHRIKADGIWTSPSTSVPTASEMAADFPEVEYSCTATRYQSAVLSVNDKVMKVQGNYAGKDFFNIFKYPIVDGTNNLNSKRSILISESLAQKLFNTSRGLIGKTVLRDQHDEFIITGIFKDLPSSASVRFEFVIPFEEWLDRNAWANGWGNTGSATYVLLRHGTDIDQFNKKLVNYINLKTNSESKHRTIFLQKYSDIYLHGTYENGKLTGGRISYVKLFSIIAIFILVIACINFMNLSTAKASRRTKEIGIKKAVGASRTSLARQYLGESILTSILSLAGAILIVDLFLGKFNIITGKELSLHFTPSFTLTLLAIGMGAGLLAGSYPALYMSGFKSVNVLKGITGSTTAEVWVRKGLVGFQFALSVILIVSVIIVYKQLDFIQSKNLGFKKDNLLYFYREGALQDDSKIESLLSELKNLPGVINASRTSHDMSGHNSGTSGIIWPGKDPDDRTEFENMAVDFGMMEMLGIELDSGRHFDNRTMIDTSSLIINEAGLKLMGIKNPIGAHVTFWGTDMEIIGICKNFHYESLHENYKPVLFRYSPQSARMIMVKIEGSNTEQTIASIKNIYQKFNPGFPFDYKFLDETFQRLYRAEERVGILSRYFAALAVIISCLGLFALSSFTAERRLKEIGIRKVLGSSEFGIVYLLSLDFTKVVLMAIVVALPISYLLVRSWLEGFAFKTPLELWYFLAAGIASLMIAWLTVGIQAHRAARVNPSKCLKED